jgi:hypothetical protein
MSTDVEDLLREGMERFTADLRAPAGLTARIARRRRRRLVLRSTAGGAAVLAAGVAALAVIVVPRVSGAGQQAVDAAYVVRNVSSALSAAAPGTIAQMTVTTTGAPVHDGTALTMTAEEWSNGEQWRSVTYSSSGHPVYDEGYSTKSGYTLVSYPTKAWARQAGLGLPYAPAGAPPSVKHGCGQALGAFPLLFRLGLPGTATSASSLPSTVAVALRTAVSCGTLAVAGHQAVDGTETIKLTSRPGSLISETIWVDPGTYLPVRVTVRSALGYSPVQQTADFTWLQPTAQNQAKLTVPIPAGFRRVPLLQAIAANLKLLPYAPLPRAKAVPSPAGSAQALPRPGLPCLGPRFPRLIGGTC